MKWKDNGYFSAFAPKKILDHGNVCSQNLPTRAKRRFSKGGGDLETTGARNDRQISRNISTVSISTSTGKFRKESRETLRDPNTLQMPRSGGKTPCSCQGPQPKRANGWARGFLRRADIQYPTPTLSAKARAYKPYALDTGAGRDRNFSNGTELVVSLVASTRTSSAEGGWTR